jgi:hypothetical protein
MPAYPAEFALGQPVLMFLDGQRCETTVIQRRFDPDAGCWFYKVRGFNACDIPADNLFTA